MPSQLHQILSKMLKQERWRKKPKLKGMLLKKEKNKKGNIKLTLKIKGSEAMIYILKRNKNLFAKAERAKEGDLLYIVGRKWLAYYFCEKLDNKGRANKEYFETNEKQMRLS